MIALWIFVGVNTVAVAILIGFLSARHLDRKVGFAGIVVMENSPSFASNLDILVNNVGGSDAPNGGYKALSDEDWQKALNVNWHPFAATTFWPGMIERKSGVILHISSIQHRLPLYDATLAYAAAKGALEYLQ